MPAPHADPETLSAASRALGALARTAGQIGEDVLSHHPVLADHATQTAVDDLVDAVAHALRGLDACASEQAVRLGVLARQARHEPRLPQDPPAIPCATTARSEQHARAATVSDVRPDR